MRTPRWMGIRKSGNDTLKILLVVSLVGVVSAFHFWTSTDYRYLHELYQRLYYIPILLAAFWYGPVVGVTAALLVSSIYLVHIRLDWHHSPVYSFNQYAEIFLYHAIALVTGVLSSREKQQRFRLEAATQELESAYRKLQDTFEQLRRADRLAALGELSAGIAHEVRNPLSSIKGSIEILGAEIPPAHPKREFVTIIEEEIERLNRVVTEVLRFARPPLPAIKPSGLAELVESTLTLVDKEARNSGIEIRLELDRGMPLVRLDPNQIRQVLLNIIINAIQAMPEGGKLRIACGIDRSRRESWLEVADSGPGISPENLEHIFDPFFSTKPSGTGLGLSICYQLVQNHAGRISAERSEWGGLLIRIVIPDRGV